MYARARRFIVRKFWVELEATAECYSPSKSLFVIDIMWFNKDPNLSPLHILEILRIRILLICLNAIISTKTLFIISTMPKRTSFSAAIDGNNTIRVSSNAPSPLKVTGIILIIVRRGCIQKQMMKEKFIPHI